MEHQKAASIFILNPKNKDFTTTRKLFDDTVSQHLLGAIWFSVIGTGGITQAISEPTNPRMQAGACVGPIMLLGGILMLILYFQKKREIRLLSLNGNVVLGRIAKSRVRKAKIGGFFTHIDYYFTLPTGKVIAGEQDQARNDIKTDADLPPPGTPIAVVYANDKVYRVL